MLQLLDMFLVALDDADVDQLLKFYHSETTCIISPNHVMVGSCSKSIFIHDYIYQY